MSNNSMRPRLRDSVNMDIGNFISQREYNQQKWKRIAQRNENRNCKLFEKSPRTTGMQFKDIDIKIINKSPKSSSK